MRTLPNGWLWREQLHMIGVAHLEELIAPLGNVCLGPVLVWYRLRPEIAYENLDVLIISFDLAMETIQEPFPTWLLARCEVRNV